MGRKNGVLVDVRGVCGRTGERLEIPISVLQKRRRFVRIDDIHCHSLGHNAHLSPLIYSADGIYCTTRSVA